MEAAADLAVAVHGADPLQNERIAPRSGRGPAAFGRPVGARDDLQAVLAQDSADRLDPEMLPVGVDVADQRCEGRSSSAAKKADAVFKIAFARRSSRTSRSSSRGRVRSSLLSPGSGPESTRACLT
jgi:hypothetical protein